MQYSAARAPHLQLSSHKILRSVSNKLAQCPYSSVEDAPHIKQWLLARGSTDSARRTLQQLNACCNWAREQGLINDNPFAVLKPIPKQQHLQVDPFSPSETKTIFFAFESNRYYRHYAPFVKFLFWTGCRPSEATALLWQDLDPALTQITIASAIVEGQRKGTKTGKSRCFPINEQLKTLLSSLGPPQSDQPVFLSPKGGVIDLHNFSNRAWKSVVGSLPFRFRSVYSTRHTFITECLRAGIPLKQVSQWVGNSPKVLLEHYAGLTDECVPEL